MIFLRAFLYRLNSLTCLFTPIKRQMSWYKLVEYMGLTTNIEQKILTEYKSELGTHYTRYTNHARRIFCLSQLFLRHELFEVEKSKLAIASAFHDIEHWSNTKSNAWGRKMIPLIEYLAAHDQLEWLADITSIINHNHSHPKASQRMRGIITAFQKACLTDQTKGKFCLGIPYSAYRKLLHRHPSRGYHRLFACRQERTIPDLADLGIATI